MQVIKNKKGTFYREKIYLDGKAIHSPRFTRKTDATQWKARMRTEKSSYQSSGILPEAFQDQSATLEEYAITWLETRVKTQLSERTYEQYKGILKKHILPRFGKMRLKEIKMLHADELIKSALANGHNATGTNMIVGMLKRILIEAVKENRLDKNPLQYLKELRQSPKSDVFIPKEEIDRVLGVSKGSMFHSLFLVAINSGMRRGELAGLCWDKVYFERGLIEISRSRDRNGLHDRTKTVKSRRYIPMNAVIKNHLMELKERSIEKFVFVDEVNGGPFDVNHVYRDLRHFLKKAGIETNYRFHDLRHTFASHFMMNGGNIYDLQKILGHTNLEMTQRYAHLGPDHLIQAANVVSFGSNHVSVCLKVAPM